MKFSNGKMVKLTNVLAISKKTRSCSKNSRFNNKDNYVSLKEDISVMGWNKKLDFIMLKSKWFMKKWKQGT